MLERKNDFSWDMIKFVNSWEKNDMDFLDYREKLGIGYCDKEKFKHFVQKMFNTLYEIAGRDDSGCVSSEEYHSFCNLTGSFYDYRLSSDYEEDERFEKCLSILGNQQDDIKNFLAYYIAFTNSIKTEKPFEGNWTRKDFVNLVVNMLDESHIQFDLIENNNEYFVFPKGVPEFDVALVSQPLKWLQDYPGAQTAWSKALKDYSAVADDNASEIADKFRKALEAFFQEFFGGRKALEGYKKNYGMYLKGQGVPAEISGNFETLLQSYTNFINNYAKHRDATSDKVLEYIMYQTGNIIRFLITLKQEE